MESRRLDSGYSGKRLIQAWSYPVCAGQTVICIYSIRSNTEFRDGCPLGGEALLVCQATGVANECFCHGDIAIKGP